MTLIFRGTILNRTEKEKVVYENGARTDKVIVEKKVSFLVEEEGKTPEILSIKLDENEKIENFKKGLNVEIPVAVNAWINGKRAQVSLKQNGKIKTIQAS